MKQVCLAWSDLFGPKSQDTDAFDQGAFLVGRRFSPAVGGSPGDIQIFCSENILQLRAAFPATLFSHCAPAPRALELKKRAALLCSRVLSAGGARSRRDGRLPRQGHRTWVVGGANLPPEVFPAWSEQLDEGPLIYLLRLMLGSLFVKKGNNLTAVWLQTEASLFA